MPPAETWTLCPRQLRKQPFAGSLHVDSVTCDAAKGRICLICGPVVITGHWLSDIENRICRNFELTRDEPAESRGLELMKQNGEALSEPEWQNAMTAVLEWALMQAEQEVLPDPTEALISQSRAARPLWRQTVCR